MENSNKRTREENCRIFNERQKKAKSEKNNEYVKKDTSEFSSEFQLKKAKIQFIEKSFHLFNDKGNKPIILNGLNMKTLVEKLKQFRNMEILTQRDINQQIEKFAEATDAEKFRAEREGGEPKEIPLPDIPDRDELSVTLSNTGTYEFRMILNVYKADAKIWLKMIRHPEDDPKKDQFCKGGIRFVTEDDLEALENYVANCINYL